MTAPAVAVRLAAEAVLVLLDRQYHAVVVICVVLDLISGLVALDVGTVIRNYTGDFNGFVSCGRLFRGHADQCAFGQISRGEGLALLQIDVIWLVVHRISGDSGRAGHGEGSISIISIHLHAAALVAGDLAAAHIELTVGAHRHAATGVIADGAAVVHFERTGRHIHAATGVVLDGTAVHIEGTLINIHAFAVASNGAAVHIERIAAT